MIQTTRRLRWHKAIHAYTTTTPGTICVLEGSQSPSMPSGLRLQPFNVGSSLQMACWIALKLNFLRSLPLMATVGVARMGASALMYSAKSVFDSPSDKHCETAVEFTPT